ncbi:MAG: N5-glutamine methyltransferase family protein [Candidatus Paceibacteria bacterium]
MTKDEKWLLDEKYGGQATAGYAADLERLAAGEPLAYIIGWQPFLDLKIYLDSRPLIPRPETEWWTEELLGAVGTSARRESRSATAREEAIFQKENTPLSSSGLPAAPHSFLDLCAGSGAVGCAALAKLPDTEVYFGEIDPAHQATIEKNIRENNLDATRATISIGDLFEPFDGMQFDIIAANPPYVPTDRILPESVADYEPSLALFAGTDGLDFVRRIAAGLKEHLKEDGVAWIEIDRGHAEASRDLFTAQGFAAEIRNDQYEKPRIIVVSFPQ